MQPLLLLLAFLLPHGAGAGEIIGGHEVKPHSRPHMTFLQFLHQELRKSSTKVVLGSHTIKEQGKTQHIPVRRAIRHPNYNERTISNDIMLLQLETKAQWTTAVHPLHLPGKGTQGDSGGPLVCKNMAQGIFSYAPKNGTPPEVFMKVSHFLPWIKRTMKHSKSRHPTELPL
ncbi:LOW QUALITY PROTEIN: granzyme H-like [Trichechus inunguis]